VVSELGYFWLLVYARQTLRCPWDDRVIFGILMMPSHVTNKSAQHMCAFDDSVFCMRCPLVAVFDFSLREESGLQGKSHLCIPFLGIVRPQSQFVHSCVL
jgi:hypothetical protein